jgi:hypothetical protein
VVVPRHPLDEVHECRFLILAAFVRIEHGVVPVIAAHVLVELERSLGPRGENKAVPRAVVHGERLTITAPADLAFVAAAHEIVRPRIEWEEDAHLAVDVGVQDHDVPVLRGADVHAAAIAREEVVVGVEPELDRRVVRANGNEMTSGCRGGECECECENHKTLLPLP